ncbi:thioesterase family protein [uncultured Phycicoccus sp.]|uniref:thioesterase family protein n=1 Tax=uncultured Phycicoccus sp. TaxID=661422 RepID=UPI0026210A09|nr:hotdog domain-containing protein [uncultured Phycicoccus sp.]
MDVSQGRRAELSCEVGPSDTAVALGSGSVAVLATPRLLAWAEAATVTALDGALGVGETSVGVRVELEHTAPSAVGEVVHVRAEVVAVDGARVVFEVEARTAHASSVGRGRIERVVVDEARFAARLRRG